MDRKRICKIVIGVLVLAGIIGGSVFSGRSFAAVTDSEDAVVMTYQEGRWFRLASIDQQDFAFVFPDGKKHRVTLRVADTLERMYYTSDEQKAAVLYTGRLQGVYVCCVSGHFLGVLSSEQAGTYYTTLFEIGQPENAAAGLSGRCDLSKAVFSEEGVTLFLGRVLYGGLTAMWNMEVTAQEQLSYKAGEQVVDVSGAYEQYVRRDLFAARELTLLTEDVLARDTFGSFFTIPAGGSVIFTDYKRLNSEYDAYQIQTDEEQGWLICSRSGELAFQGADLPDVLGAEETEKMTVTGPDADPQRRTRWDFVDFAMYLGDGEHIGDYGSQSYGAQDEEIYIGFDVITRDEPFFTVKCVNDSYDQGKSSLLELPEDAEDFLYTIIYGERMDRCLLIIQYAVGEQYYSVILIRAGLWFIPLHFCEMQTDGSLLDLGIVQPEKLIEVTEQIDHTIRDGAGDITDERNGSGLYEMDFYSCEMGITCTGEWMLQLAADSGASQWRLEDVNHLVRQ